jgi:CheY-like chemotaxis protein/DNA-binding CsgD family transcriptional regulator
MAMEIFKGKTILVADDDPGNRELVVSTMNSLLTEIKVLSAIDGGQVLEIMKKRQVNAVLLDWEMPVMDGFTVLKAIRSNPEWSEIPILMYTGVMTATHNLVKALEAGATDFIRKPAEPIELIARIRSALQRYEDFSIRMQLEKENAEIKTKLLESQIQKLREELGSYLMQLARKNEILINLRDKLGEDNIEKQHASGSGAAANIENYWDEFFQRFSQIDNQFLVALSQKHNELSPAEIKFCVLVRSGMGSKDIASLINVTPAAIEKTRYRIRKKLELEPEQSLEKYIFSI